MINSRPDFNTFIESIREHVSYEESMKNYNETLIEQTDWGVTVTYENKKVNKQLLFKNYPKYTDYGFSVELVDSKKQRNIFISIPHEFQDNQCFFVKYSLMMMYSDKKIIKLIQTNHEECFDEIRYTIDEDRYLKALKYK